MTENNIAEQYKKAKKNAIKNTKRDRYIQNNADEDIPTNARIHRARRIGIILLSIIAIYYGIAFFAQRSIIYPSWAATERPEMADNYPDLEKLKITIPEGEVEAWFMPGDGVSKDKPGPLVIFAHGNGEVIDGWPKLLQQYQRMGISVLLPEYRGYGRSAGSPSQAGITADFVAFYDMMVQRPDVDNAKIIFQGRSLGGGVVCSLANERQPAAMILTSTFSSMSDMMNGFFIPSLLCRDKYLNTTTLEHNYAGPLLIAHGSADEVIPFDHMKHLIHFANQNKLRSTEPRMISLNAGHNDQTPYMYPSELWREIDDFLNATFNEQKQADDAASSTP